MCWTTFDAEKKNTGPVADQLFPNVRPSESRADCFNFEIVKSDVKSHAMTMTCILSREKEREREEKEGEKRAAARERKRERERQRERGRERERDTNASVSEKYEIKDYQRLQRVLCLRSETLQLCRHL